MKERPSCKTIYNDYDQYCLKCNYKLQVIKDSKIVDYNPNSNIIDKSQTQQSANIPKCPTCGSTNIRRISTAEKAAGVILFGIFSNKRKYQFECQNPNCKYKW